MPPPLPLFTRYAFIVLAVVVLALLIAGLFFAVPLTVVTMILVQRLYVARLSVQYSEGAHRRSAVIYEMHVGRFAIGAARDGCRSATGMPPLGARIRSRKIRVAPSATFESCECM